MKTKAENPVEAIWRIRDALAAEEGNNPRAVFKILRREEKKYGQRVQLLHEPAKEPALLREEPPPHARKPRRKP